MIKIIFEAHSTTVDNEQGVSSGLYDTPLSEVGIQQAKELGRRYKDVHLDAVFVSSLKRSIDPARIAFADRPVKIISDARLNEVDYGDLQQHPKQEVESVKGNYINQPFPNGESYQQTTDKIKAFLDDIKKDYDGKTVLIIGHRATQYGLEHLLNGVALEKAVTGEWRWQPGWEYILEKI